MIKYQFTSRRDSTYTSLMLDVCFWGGKYLYGKAIANKVAMVILHNTLLKKVAQLHENVAPLLAESMVVTCHVN